MRFLLFYIPIRLYGLKGSIYFNANKKHNDQVKEETGFFPNLQNRLCVAESSGKGSCNLQHYIFDECTRKENCIQFFVFPISFPHK